MKNLLGIIAVVVLSIIAGAYLHKCQTPQQAYPPGTVGDVVIDTVTYIDTVPYSLPSPRQELSLGTQIRLLPVFISKDSTSGFIPDSCKMAEENIPPEIDSMAVEIPITQREYEGDDYHAWVSGYAPRLDSISVFPRIRTVTIRQPPGKPKRWHIGPSIGLGCTPKGIAPYIGVSVTYSIISF